MRMRAYHTSKPKDRKRHIISCQLHRARNTLAKVSAHDQPQVKADFWAIFDVSDAPSGGQAVAVARQQAAAFAATWQRRYPSAVACVADDLASLTVHLLFPAEHRKRIRHSNLISVNRPGRALEGRVA
jgi:putative transposase